MREYDYIVFVPPSSHPECSGGQIVLRQLATNLSKLGKRVAVTNCPISVGDAVAIYPEVICGNPLKARRVVRWLLNTPEVTGGDGLYDDDDFVFTFAEYFSLEGRQADGLLTAFNFDLDFWRDLHYPRLGTSFIVRKGGGKPYVHSPLALKLDSYYRRGGHNIARLAFNLTRRFISYDHATMLSPFAALCGADSIVIPDGKTSAKEWRQKFPYFKYGIAYGLDDLDYARKTRNRIRENLAEIERQGMDEARAFIRIVERGRK